MKEQELMQTLQRLAEPAAFSKESRLAVWQKVQEEQLLDDQQRRPVCFAPRKLTFALAMLMLLLTVTAVAASKLGILDFAKENGQPAPQELLVTDVQQYTYKLVSAGALPIGAAYHLDNSGSSLVSVTVEELLYHEGSLHAAMTVSPKLEGAMVLVNDMQFVDETTGKRYLRQGGNIRDLYQPGTMAFADNPEIDPQMSVKEYADAHGFGDVIHFGIDLFVEHSHCLVMADGSLQLLVQMEYNPYQRENYPDQIVNVMIPVEVALYDEQGKIPDDCEMLELELQGYFRIDSRTKRSLPEDAHDIVGYRGFVESVSVTKLSEDQVSLIIQLDQEKRNYHELQMSGPNVVVLDDAGNVLYEDRLYRDVNSMITLGDDRIQHNILIPAQGVPEDRITIRLENWRNSTVVYDEYTYTLN